jgi:hypothetical protein
VELRVRCFPSVHIGCLLAAGEIAGPALPG